MYRISQGPLAADSDRTRGDVCGEMAGAGLMHELLMDGVVHKIGRGLQLHFFQDPGAVRAYGFDTQPELLCDFGHRFSYTNQTQDLQFAVG